MALTKPTHFDIAAYLESKGIPFDTVTPLSGGNANFVYRLEFDPDIPRIIKHAEPYIASSPQYPLAVDRMNFEHRALNQIPNCVPANKDILLPQVYSYDAQSHVLIMEDGGKLICRAFESRSGQSSEHHSSSRQDQLQRRAHDSFV